MLRKIIKIDEEKCDGCGLCADACHEGAIGIVNNKAKLLREDYCDGLGDCLPVCPKDAITFEEREAQKYNEEAVKENLRQKNGVHSCPGSMTATFNRKDSQSIEYKQESALKQWPIQIKLVPINAPYFEGADILVAADCTPFAYGSFHKDFISGKITLIGCPKLDDGDYSEKLTEIFAKNNIKSVTVTRMEVPCCGGIEFAVKKAVEQSGKAIPIKTVIISVNGEILED